MTTTLAYNDASQLLSESYSGGTLSGLSLTNGYDSLLRRTAVGLSNYSGTLTTYGYDTASRLQTVTSGTNTASYAYLANSPLVSQILFTNGSTQRMVTTKSYDNLSRLTNLVSAAGATTVASFTYQYNSANQRTQRTDADASYWVYQYDSLGQVTSGKKYWSDDTPVAGQQFEYGFDDIGNRNTTASGGDQYGANLRSAGYTNNALNQITSRGVPGYVDVLGSATNTATVTVNDQATYRHNDYFRAELTAANNSPLWFGVTNVAVVNNGTNADIVTSTTGFVFVAQSPETFGYDADGNLTNDGRWTLTWDAENRLVNQTSLSSTPSATRLKLDFEYDAKGRRIQKVASTWNGSSYVAQSTNRFLYDGWNLLAELNNVNALVRSYVWGLDLSGSEQGAGGVGGLLNVAYYGTQTTNGFAAFDGNGNVAALVNAADGNAVANYEYDPFGQTIRATGLMARYNPFRFSTKYQEDESDFAYYGYRHLNPSTGRWLNRDPIGEQGGKNVYQLVKSNPVNLFDGLGLKCCVLQYSGSSSDGLLYDHIAVECDNGVYISAFPQSGQMTPAATVVFKDKDHDEKRWGKPTSTVCFDCVDANAVSAWFQNAKNGAKEGTCKFDGLWNNCSDMGRQAIEAGLPKQTKPTCPACPFPEHKYQVIDLLADPLLPSRPNTFERQARVLKENGCQRFKCELVFTPRRPLL